MVVPYSGDSGSSYLETHTCGSHTGGSGSSCQRSPQSCQTSVLPVCGYTGSVQRNHLVDNRRPQKFTYWINLKCMTYSEHVKKKPTCVTYNFFPHTMSISKNNKAPVENYNLLIKLAMIMSVWAIHFVPIQHIRTAYTNCTSTTRRQA